MENNRRYITVTELNYYLNRIIDAEELLKDCLVLGEVSGIAERAGSLYFTLKDENAQLSVACFQAAKTYKPQNGEQVLLTGSPDYYQKGGKLTFIVRKIEPFGKGKLHLALEERKQRLAAEGLFDERYKKKIPPYPMRVGVVTSAGGAVIKDIESTVRAYNPMIDLFLVDVPVQGERAAKKIIEGLLQADEAGLDVIILARGGGSFEDLLPFQDEDLARVIFSIETPIISAVGHETDFSISDFVADVRALTPTAAAELVSFDVRALKKEIIHRLNRMERRVREGVRIREEQVRRTARAVGIGAAARLDEAKRHVLYALRQADSGMQKRLLDCERKTERALAKVSALNPAALLKKGYFRAEKDGTPLADITAFAVDDVFLLHGEGGRLKAKVIDINNTKSD